MGGPSFVALLRGINVTGRNPIAMNDLRDLVEALPADHVRTYVQSGNVVFRSAVDDPDRLARAIEARIRSQMGLDVAVLVRTAEDLSRVLAGSPFLTHGWDRSRLHVTFLAAAPDSDRRAALRAPADTGTPDTFEMREREIHLHCPNGYGRTKFNNAFFERKLAVVATTRNWRTVTTLTEMARE